MRNKSNRSNRGALIALLAVFACGLIGAGVLLHRTKSGRLESLRQTLGNKQAEVEEVRAKVKEMPKLEGRYEGLHRQVAVLEPALPTEAYIPTFLSQLQTLAGQTNNRLMVIQPKPKRKLPTASAAPEGDVVDKTKTDAAKPVSPKPKPEAVSPYDEIEIELGLRGTYWTALEFLERLRAFPKMIAVNEISMKPVRTGMEVAGAQPILEVGLQLTAVIAKEK